MAKTSNSSTSQNNSQNQYNSKIKDSNIFTADLARWTIIFTFGGIALLGICAISSAAAPGLVYVFQKQGDVNDIKEGFSNIKDILSLLLPVMSAWAGTVFAFYFGRESFQTASDSSAALVRQFTSEEKLKSIVVKDVMIKIEDADKLILEKNPKEINLKTEIIEGILDEKRRERLPILDKEGRIKYMAHRSLIDKFIAQRAYGNKKIADLTLEDMLSDPTFGKILRDSFCVVAETSSLSDAKSLMEKVDDCADIFITSDAKSTSKAVGWVTDVIVREKATI
jgi:hypothetical protein